MNRIQILLILLPIIQAVKVKVGRDNEKSTGIVNINANKGPVLYPSAARQTMSTTTTSTTTSTIKTPNNTYNYQKGFLPIPMATLETTTVRQQNQQHERRGFSTASQEVDEQIPSTPEVKLAKYEISEQQDSYEGGYKEQLPPLPTHLFSPISSDPVPPYKFESVEDQMENNEVYGTNPQYGDFKGYHMQDHHLMKHEEHKEESQPQDS